MERISARLLLALERKYSGGAFGKPKDIGVHGHSVDTWTLEHLTSSQGIWSRGPDSH